MSFKSIFRGIAAVLAGIVSGAVLSIATDTVLETTGVFPSLTAQIDAGVLLATWQLLLATFYRTVYTALSGYLGAKIAPSHPMRYAIALGAIATFANLGGLAILPDPSQAWYPILLAALSLPATWLGGKLATR